MPQRSPTDGARSPLRGMAAAAATASRGAVLAVAVLALLLQLAVVAAGGIPLPVLAGALAVAVVPALGVTVWFVDRSPAVPSLPRLGLVAVAAATLAMIPAVLHAVAGFTLDTGVLVTAVALYGIGVPLLEETVKQGATRYGDLDAGQVGLALGAVAGLGFAVTETTLAVAAAGFVGGDVATVALARAPLASLHVICGATAGAVRYRGGARGGLRSLVLAVGAAAALHGTYNVLAWSEVAVPVPLAGDVPLATAFLGLVVVAAYLVTWRGAPRLGRPDAPTPPHGAVRGPRAD